MDLELSPIAAFSAGVLVGGALGALVAARVAGLLLRRARAELSFTRARARALQDACGELAAARASLQSLVDERTRTLVLSSWRVRRDEPRAAAFPGPTVVSDRDAGEGP